MKEQQNHDISASRSHNNRNRYYYSIEILSENHDSDSSSFCHGWCKSRSRKQILHNFDLFLCLKKAPGIIYCCGWSFTSSGSHCFRTGLSPFQKL